MRRVLASVTIAAALTAFSKPLPVDQQPMYGGQERTEAMKKADDEFLEKVASMGYTRESGSAKSVELGWQYFFKGDIATAMRRFNQAWLLNSENGDVYHGFAVVTAERGGSLQEAERYFRMALTKAGVDPYVYVDYARLLNVHGRFDDALVQGQNAIAADPRTRNARIQISYSYYSKKDASNACYWGRQAKEHGDVIDPPNYVEGICEYAERAAE